MRNSDRKGRAAQINTGIAAAAGAIVLVIHRDAEFPADAAAVVAETLADPAVALAGFAPAIAGPAGGRPVSIFHTWIKTSFAPRLFHGLRLPFGDRAMFSAKAISSVSAVSTRA